MKKGIPLSYCAFLFMISLDFPRDEPNPEFESRKKISYDWNHNNKFMYQLYTTEIFQ